MSRILTVILFFSALLFSAFASATELSPVKYVILFIGDGMSLPQRQMAEEYSQRTAKQGLRINAMPYQGINTTYASDAFITDSAAAGTAIACGGKTNNGVLGLGPNGEKYESVAELAKKNGRKVGIITSVTLNHATPAAFYAHNASRGNDYEIGLDLVASGFDYFGGGLSKHNDEKAKQYKGDIYALAEEAGYTLCRTEEEIRSVKTGNGKILALGAEADLPYAIDVPAGGVRLADFTRQAIEHLDNPSGFFLMVEGGKIDWMCHANDAATTIHEILEFDKAAAAGLDFAAKHPKETLVLVTGDHETGALTVGFSGTGYQIYIDLLAHQKASLDALAKIIQNFHKDNGNDAFDKLKPMITEKTGLQFTEKGEWKKGNLVLTKAEVAELEKRYKGADTGKTMARAILRMLNNKAGISWASENHSALPVCTSAFCTQAEVFTAIIRDNTDIAKNLKQMVAPVKNSAP